MNQLTIYKHRVSRIRHWASCGENPTLAHFRHFSSLLTNLSSTLVKSPLQITYFLCKTNPILSAVGGLQMNVNLYNTTDYENKWQRKVRKNKPNTNPIQTQFKPNSNPIQTQSKPISEKPKMNVNKVSTKDYNNEQRTMNNERLCKTNPIKPNFKLEANLSLRERRSLRVSFSESSNRGPISKAKKCPSPDISHFFCNFCALFNHFSLFFTLLFEYFRMFSNVLF